MGRKRKGLPISGWIVLDKHEGLGSTQAVSRVRDWVGSASQVTQENHDWRKTKLNRALAQAAPSQSEMRPATSRHA